MIRLILCSALTAFPALGQGQPDETRSEEAIKKLWQKYLNEDYIDADNSIIDGIETEWGGPITDHTRGVTCFHKVVVSWGSQSTEYVFFHGVSSNKELAKLHAEQACAGMEKPGKCWHMGGQLSFEVTAKTCPEAIFIQRTQDYRLVDEHLQVLPW